MSHTPGPWFVETETKAFEVCTMHGVQRQPTEDGIGQSWVYIRPLSLYRDGEWHWPSEREQLANARLIAAAPDLLAALIEAREELSGYEQELTGESYNNPKLNAAIAKAEG